MSEGDLKEFIREITLRHERASREMQEWLRIADERTREMIRRGDEMVRRTDVMIAEFRDLRAESLAQRAALFQMLDRLGPGGAEPA